MNSWEREEESPSNKHVLAIGTIDAEAHDYCSCGCGIGPSWSLHFCGDDDNWQASSLEDAQSKAQGALLEMLEALSKHFAPIVKWEDNGDGESIAKNVHGWTLGASFGNWWLSHPTSDTLIRSPRPNQASETDNRRAAETALRSFGLVFRLEEE